MGSNGGKKQGWRNTGVGVVRNEEQRGGRADWLRRRPPGEAERGGTTSGLERGGQSRSFGGAWRVNALFFKEKEVSCGAQLWIAAQ